MIGMWLAAGNAFLRSLKRSTESGALKLHSENTPMSKKTNLVLSSYAHRSNPVSIAYLHFLLSTCCIFSQFGLRRLILESGLQLFVFTSELVLRANQFTFGTVKPITGREEI